MQINLKLNRKKLIEQAEDISDIVSVIFGINKLLIKLNDFRPLNHKLVKYTKQYYPTIARICLLSGIINEACSYLYYYEIRSQVMHHHFGTNTFLNSIFVITIYVTQIFCAIMLFLRKNVDISAAVIGGSIIIQVFVLKLFIRVVK